jgi:pilus assembly protein Flp/PilA
MRLTAVWISMTNRFRRGDDGASLVEYAFLLALIAIVCLLAVTFLGNQTSTRYSGFGSAMDAAGH